MRTRAKQREYNRRYYAKHRARIRETARAHRASNADKVREYNRRYYAGNREKLLRDSRAGALRRVYGLTEDAFTEMLAAQGGGCAICGASEPGGAGSFHVDHCHKTGAVRGLLCHGCNVGIGSLKDDPKVLYSAIEYLLGAIIR